MAPYRFMPRLLEPSHHILLAVTNWLPTVAHWKIRFQESSLQYTLSDASVADADTG